MSRRINQRAPVIAALTETGRRPTGKVAGSTGDARLGALTLAEDRFVLSSLADEENGFLHVADLNPCEEQRQRSAKFPLFDPTFPLFEHDRPDHGLTARTADRAVL